MIELHDLHSYLELILNKKIDSFSIREEERGIYFNFSGSIFLGGGVYYDDICAKTYDKFKKGELVPHPKYKEKIVVDNECKFNSDRLIKSVQKCFNNPKQEEIKKIARIVTYMIEIYAREAEQVITSSIITYFKYAILVELGFKEESNLIRRENSSLFDK